MKPIAVALLALLVAFSPLGAQQRQAPVATAPASQTTPPQPGEPSTGDPPARTEVASPTDDRASQTSHVVRLDGREIKYTATAGTLPIRLDDGKVAARMFFVAYTKDGEDVKIRPISFLYNGGPGSSSVWLHMGSF